MTSGSHLSVRVVSMNKLKLTLMQDPQGLYITVEPSIGNLPGGVRLQFINTSEGKAHLEVSFEDPNPYVSVFESDGETIYIGMGTPLNEGVKASLHLSASQAEEFIRDMQRQLGKRACLKEGDKDIENLIAEEIRILQAVVDSVEDYVLMEAENIESDTEHKGMLKEALEHFKSRQLPLKDLLEDSKDA